MRVIPVLAGICILTAAGAAGSQLSLSVAWQVEGANGWSAPNAVVDTRTGAILYIAVCERDVGVVALSARGERLWEYPLESPAMSSPAVADLDGDGREDVVAADGQGNLVALRGDGTPMWTARTPGGVRDGSCPAIADLDGDGRPEVLVGDTEGFLSCFDSDGALRWRFSGEGTMGPVLIADLYDTEGQEIIAPSHDRHIYALTGDGDWLWDLYAPDDLFPNSTPVLADVDGDGAPELYVGGGLHHFYQVDLRRPRFTSIENVYLHINGSITAADLDGDGRDEVVFGNKGGALYCFGQDGIRWQTELPHASLHAAPLIANLDADEALEILAYSALGKVHFVDTDGSLLLSAPTPVALHATPLLADLDSDGSLELAGGGEGGYASSSFLLADLGVPYQSHPGNRFVYAGDRAHTGRAPAAPHYALLPAPGLRAAEAQGASFAGSVELLSGDNTWRFDVANPQERSLVFLTDLTYPDGRLQHTARHVRSRAERVAVEGRITAAGAYRVRHRLIDARDLSALADREAQHRFEGFATDQAYLRGVLDAAWQEARHWERTNPARARPARAGLAALRGELLQLEGLDPADRLSQLETLRHRGERLRALVVAGRGLAPQGSFAAWEYSPWAYFSPDATVPRPEDATAALEAQLCMGEYESLALNVTSFASEALEVRAWCEDLEGPVAAAARDHLQLHRAVVVPTVRGHRVADALPRLDGAGALTVPALQSQQLWITVNAVDLPPGNYTSRLHLKSVEADPTEIVLPLELTVHDLALPRPRPLRFCQWAYDGGDLGTDRPAVLRDLVEHGVTVFFGQAPAAVANAEGELLEIDYAVMDEQIARLSPHGMMMFISPQGGLKGVPLLSEPWKEAFVAYLRAWAGHMEELGLEYGDWALYPYDEPSTPYAETTLKLVEVATVVRRADPQILVYTDPTSGTTMETVEMLGGLVDIWCPSAELLERLGPELVPAAQRLGKEVWFYDAAGRAKGLSALGMYRWRFWYAWNLGFTGAGWWVYSHHGPDRWDGPNRTGDFFATVYDGPAGPVSSKRWEAAREGIEDYEYLWLLRSAIDAARSRGVAGEVLEQAQELLAQAPVTMQQILHQTGRRQPLTPDGVPLYEEATRALNETRQRLVEACLALRAE